MGRYVIKRNKTKEKFDSNKIINALELALKASGENINKIDINNLISNIIKTDNDIPIELIQDKIEEMLMEKCKYKTAHNFITYREQHRDSREIRDKIKFIQDYTLSTNAADGSKYDSNANVTSKNISTLSGEINKLSMIKINRSLTCDQITKLYGKELAKDYLDLLNNHIIYKNDETNLANYCASITMYPWLLNGLTNIGGNSTKPTNLKSFCGGFINLVFMVSGMLSGAVATPEFIMYMDYFIRKEYGDDYHNKLNEIVELSLKKRTLNKVINDCFEQIVYSINQPTGARNFQSVFFNISYYDKYYFKSLFENFKFPDNTSPCWESTSKLQKIFMTWFNNERTKAVLTYPVETMALLSENGKIKDKDYEDFTSEMYSQGHSFFTYISNNVDSLSSCCRLRNEIKDNEFSYTLGAGGVSTGSKSVLTINLNRSVQYAHNNKLNIINYIHEVIDKMHKFQIAYDTNLREIFLNNDLLPLFNAGYININRQYLTIGINGLVESAEFLGIDIDDNKEYQEYVESILSTIEKLNKQYKTKELMFNCEMIPAESVGVKFAKWDKRDGYKVSRDCYNSYFYLVESNKYTVLDKFKLHGIRYIGHLTGGSALHANMAEHLSKEQYKNLINVAAQEGCNYFTFNIPNTICNDCNNIDKRYLTQCPKCGSKNIDYLTRIIGYLRRISNFNLNRRIEASKRFYDNKN